MSATVCHGAVCDSFMVQAQGSQAGQSCLVACGIMEVLVAAPDSEAQAR